MCARCEELLEEVAYLRSELGLQRQVQAYDRLHETYGVTRSECRILMALNAARGRPLTRDQLEDALASEASNFANNLINVFVSKIRKKIGRECIALVWGQGYRMTPEGLTKISAVVAEPTTQVAA